MNFHKVNSIHSCHHQLTEWSTSRCKWT